jgi:hypothetical protein
MGASAGEASPSRIDLLLTGAGLVGGFVCAVIAAFTPPAAVWASGGSAAVRLIARHLDQWQRANWFFGVGIVATLVGMAVLAVALGRLKGVPGTPMAALALMIVASTLWLTDLSARLSVTSGVAADVAAGRAVPGWYDAFDRWTDGSLLTATGLVGGVAMVLVGLSPALGGVFPRWAMWTTAALGLLLVVEVVLTHDVIPALLYLAPAPLGATALWRAARGGPAHPQALAVGPEGAGEAR